MGPGVNWPRTIAWLNSSGVTHNHWFTTKSLIALIITYPPPNKVRLTFENSIKRVSKGCDNKKKKISVKRIQVNIPTNKYFNDLDDSKSWILSDFFSPSISPNNPPITILEKRIIEVKIRLDKVRGTKIIC